MVSFIKLLKVDGLHAELAEVVDLLVEPQVADVGWFVTILWERFGEGETQSVEVRAQPCEDSLYLIDGEGVSSWVLAVGMDEGRWGIIFWSRL